MHSMKSAVSLWLRKCRSNQNLPCSRRVKKNTFKRSARKPEASTPYVSNAAGRIAKATDLQEFSKALRSLPAIRLAPPRYFRVFIRLCHHLRHKETDTDYQHQARDTERSFPGHPFADHSFPDHSFRRGRPHREVSFHPRLCSLSFIISSISATGRISTGPSPYLKPGSCETS